MFSSIYGLIKHCLDFIMTDRRVLLLYFMSSRETNNCVSWLLHLVQVLLPLCVAVPLHSSLHLCTAHSPPTAWWRIQQTQSWESTGRGGVAPSMPTAPQSLTTGLRPRRSPLRSKVCGRLMRIHTFWQRLAGVEWRCTVSHSWSRKEVRKSALIIDYYYSLAWPAWAAVLAIIIWTCIVVIICLCYSQGAKAISLPMLLTSPVTVQKSQKEMHFQLDAILMGTPSHHTTMSLGLKTLEMPIYLETSSTSCEQLTVLSTLLVAHSPIH